MSVKQSQKGKKRRCCGRKAAATDRIDQRWQPGVTSIQRVLRGKVAMVSMNKLPNMLSFMLMSAHGRSRGNHAPIYNKEHKANV